MCDPNTSRPLNTLKGIGLVAILAFAVACAGGDPAGGGASTAPTPATPATPSVELITADQIVFAEQIDQGMVARGESIYDVKCQACHTLGTNRVVGPGWKGLLEHRKPEWIMNMIVHTDAMLETDPEAQAMLEECLVRMPNQNLTFDDARDVLEFIRTL